MFKKILSLVLTLVMVLALGTALVSCSDESDDNNGGNTDTPVTPETPDDGGDKPGETKETYTVTVKDAEGNPVVGAKLAKVDVSGAEDFIYDDEAFMATTDAEGKATFSLKGDRWEVKVISLPKNRGYIDPEVNFSFTDKAVTITISLLPKYTIKVVDQNGDAVVGAVVQMCINTGDDTPGACVSFRMPTDASGESSVRAKADNYEANFTSGAPEGYTYDGGYVPFESDGNSGYISTIVVTKN